MSQDEGISVLLPGDPIDNHWHDVRFLKDSELSDSLAKPNQGAVKIMALSDPALKDKYWLCRGRSLEEKSWHSEPSRILSTYEVIACFAGGQEVLGWTGPHATVSEARECEDAAWGPDFD